MTAACCCMYNSCAGKDSLGEGLPAGVPSRHRQRRRAEASRATQYAAQPAIVDGSNAASSTGNTSSTESHGSSAPPPRVLQRRSLLLGGAGAAAAATACAALPSPAQSTQLPEAIDKAWEGLGGGPADLTFPASFAGVWDVDSVLVGVDTPLGPEFVPDMRVVQRAVQEDLNAVVRYQVAFMQNQRGEMVPDRRFNTASLMQTYTGTPADEVQRRIVWNPDDPNQLQLSLPGGLQVSTRVTRRSEERQGSDRLATSEFFQQLISTSQEAQPRVKASQCFTKYHWRSAEAAATSSAGGALIVATQVVSDYLTAYDGSSSMMETRGRPVVVYTYRMAFSRPGPPAPASAGVVS